MKSKQVKFKMPKGCSVREIVVRETTGKDEGEAVALAKQKGEKGSFLDEMVKRSIMSVDGSPVSQPFTDLEEWSSKTRSYALKAYLKVNGTDDNESEDFLQSAELYEGSGNTANIDDLIGSAGSGSHGTSAGALPPSVTKV